MLCVFLAQCHHVVCYGVVDRLLRNIKIDQHLVPAGSFFAFQIADDVRNAYEKKPPMRSQWKAIVEFFLRGSEYQWLEGQEIRQFSATKINFEKPLAGSGSHGWIRNSPLSARLYFYFRLINLGRVIKVFKLGIVLPLLPVLKINLIFITQL